MKNAQYESPKMVFASVRNESAVAAQDGPCMSMAAKGSNFYFDTPGYGYVQVIPVKANCSGNVNFRYYPNRETGAALDADGQRKAFQEAKAALEANKQAFAGAYYFPQPDFS